MKYNNIVLINKYFFIFLDSTKLKIVSIKIITYDAFESYYDFSKLID